MGCGHAVYDEAVTAELVAACGRRGSTVSRLARGCESNANQLSRWVHDLVGMTPQVLMELQGAKPVQCD